MLSKNWEMKSSYDCMGNEAWVIFSANEITEYAFPKSEYTQEQAWDEWQKKIMG